jgi:hypothetical protein
MEAAPSKTELKLQGVLDAVFKKHEENLDVNEIAIIDSTIFYCF